MIIAILAAGKGKRMRPLTDTRLKGSMPIHNREILLRLADMLHSSGQMDKLVLVISPWQLDAMKELFADTVYAQKVEFTIQDPPKGTGDAVAQAEPFVGDEKQCLVLNGDINADLEEILPRLIEQHETLQAKCTILVFPGKGARYGQLQVTPEGRVLDIKEKIKGEKISDEIGYINAGVYLFDREIFDAIRKTPLSERGEYEITDAISILGKNGTIGAVITESWMSFENPLDIFKAQSYFKVSNKLHNMQFHSGGEIGFKAAEDVFFDAETEIEFSSIKIKGPVLVGKGTLIETGSEIGPYVYLGRDCLVESHVSLKKSLLMDNVKIEANCEIYNFISAEEVLVGKDSKIIPRLPRKVPGLESFVVVGGKTIFSANVEITSGVLIKAHSVIKQETEIKSDY